MEDRHHKREAVKAELHVLRESAHVKREHLHEVGEEPIKIAGHSMTKADLYKFVGLIVFFVLVVVGIALHSLLNGKLLYSVSATILTVGLMFALLFLWLLG